MGYRGFVKYWDLGRSRANGAFFLTAKDEDEFNRIMLMGFSKHLVSEDIGFTNGKIYAGNHVVGNFSFIAIEVGEPLNNVCARVYGCATDPKLATTRNERRTARWGKDTPMTKETQEKLIDGLKKHMINKKYNVGTDRNSDQVRRAVLYCPIAVEHVWDSEEEARETLKKLEEENAKKDNAPRT
jgi:hypothetical protein